MANKSKIKFGLLGYGSIGKRHADVIMQNPETELVAICDAKPPEQLGITNGKIPYFNSLESLFESGPDFDVLSIATPNGLHAEHALAAIQAKKHVVIEKPMALKKSDCEKIIFKALQANRHVFCVMQNRYSPPSSWIKSLIDSGTLGSIYMVQINCFWNRDDRYYKKGDWKGTIDLDGGVLFTQFSHFVDMMYWLFGDITDIQATFRDFNHSKLTEFEDSAIILFKFLEGGMGSINFSTSVWDKNMESSVTIIAENGSVKISGQYMNEVVHCHVKDYVMPILPPTNPPNDYGFYKGSASNHQYVFENVVDVLKGRTTIKTNALEGYKVVEIIEQIYSLRKLAFQSYVTKRPSAHEENGMAIVQKNGMLV
jgi:UDP-N-acetyl-2-amino-2-deoxyglucuronate dehydrogenase